jgi:hypothetical protein
MKVKVLKAPLWQESQRYYKDSKKTATAISGSDGE